MSRWPGTLWRGIPLGLALLFCLPAAAEDTLREQVRRENRERSYVLVEDNNGARLLLFSTDAESSGTARRFIPAPSDAASVALDMTRDASSRTRVRGLTLLSGIAGPDALDAGLVLLSDPVAAVREEAVQLVLEHPDADIAAVIEIAANDPSPRVRDAIGDFLDERAGD